MESFKIENLSFKYPLREEKTLDNVNIKIEKGEFVTVMGASGSGKTTLLRLLKPEISPHGSITGKIYFEGGELSQAQKGASAGKIGFVMQDPDNQIVTDKVWHELAFGLESIGLPQGEIRKRVAESAAFFGLQDIFYGDTASLSGGQKQLLNLAAVMALSPSVLILDEPSAQLDPIAAEEFFNVLVKINREMGTTVILAEHSLGAVFPVSSKVILLDGGKVIADGDPKAIGEELIKKDHIMYDSLPVPSRVYYGVGLTGESPLTVGGGRAWLSDYAKTHELFPEAIEKRRHDTSDETAIELKNVWFRYEKNLPDVIKGLSFSVKKGEIFGIVGSNGAGKSTALMLASGIGKPYRGEVLIGGKNIEKIKEPYDSLLGVLPQSPKTLFSENTLYLDLLKRLGGKDLSDDEKHRRVIDAARRCGILNLLKSHPYDLSGGETERAALAKVLLGEPEILILDEPTKGLDNYLKDELAEILTELKNDGAAILLVTHDIEFAAALTDRCAMLFNGEITFEAPPEEFFRGNSFYTTAANRMARGIIPGVLCAEDIISACTKRKPMKRKREKKDEEEPDTDQFKKAEEKRKPSLARIISGCFFIMLFVLTFFLPGIKLGGIKITKNTLDIVGIIFIAAALMSFFPGREIGISLRDDGKRLDKRTLLSVIPILFLIPLTVFFGVRFLGDRKYYFISLLIVIEAMLPFFSVFEKRKPKAKELVIISVMSAIAVAGRTAFYMTMQFKPVAAIVIISGLSLGAEAGFLVGAVTALCSNMFFGQGPWTPWQMFAFGIIGFLSGILFKKGLLGRTKTALSVYGFIVTLVLYGAIMNFSYVVQSQAQITKGALIAAVISGLPFDIVHASSSAFFLWFLSEPMVYKLERVKLKYGI